MEESQCNQTWLPSKRRRPGACCAQTAPFRLGPGRTVTVLVRPPGQTPCDAAVTRVMSPSTGIAAPGKCLKLKAK